MKKLLILITVIAFGTPALAAEFEVGASRDTYLPTFLFPGDVAYAFGELDDTFPGDYDIFYFIPVGTGRLSITVEDLDTMGDAIMGFLLNYMTGSMSFAYAVSPMTVPMRGMVSDWGIYGAIVSYMNIQGTFPVEYYIEAEF